MKRALKIFGLLLLIIFVGGFIFYLVKNEPLPEGTANDEADAMARDMLTAMNVEAWDSTEVVSWVFRGGHSYVWNRKNDLVIAKWGDYQAEFTTRDFEGEVLKNGTPLNEEETLKILQKARDNFNNDSFWLAAPYKVFDPGTIRSIVTCKDGRKGLMVTYTTGGTTPGDSYVWILGEDGRPTSVKMWVSILPVGGMEFTWENYQTLPSGALVAQDHFALGLMNVKITGIR